MASTQIALSISFHHFPLQPLWKPGLPVSIQDADTAGGTQVAQGLSSSRGVWVMVRCSCCRFCALFGAYLGPIVILFPFLLVY